MQNKNKQNSLWKEKRLLFMAGEGAGEGAAEAEAKKPDTTEAQGETEAVTEEIKDDTHEAMDALRMEENVNLTDLGKIQSISLPDGEDERSPSKVVLTIDGEEKVMDSKTVIHNIGEGDNSISVDAGTAYHIYHLHISGDVPGSQFKGMSLEGVAKMIEEKFDLAAIAQAQAEGVGPLEEHKFVGTIDVGLEGATTGVATLSEMLAAGIITQEQIDDLKSIKDQVAEANRTANGEQQKALMDEFNAKGYAVSLGQRFPGAPVTPFFDSAPMPTTEMAVIVIDGKLITTMTGHHREKLPFGPQASIDFAKGQKDGSPAKEGYNKDIEKFGSEEELLKRLEAEFPTNSDDWLEAGFIQKKKEPEAEKKAA